MWTIKQEDYLMHHGIKGQKWGIRRYQNPDGSLTAEGRERYGLNDADKPIKSNLSLKKRTKMLKKRIKKCIQSNRKRNWTFSGSDSIRSLLPRYRKSIKR